MINKAFNFMNQKLLIIIFTSCIFIACFSLIIVYSNRIIFTEIDKFEGIEIESIMNTCEKYNLVVYYPITKNNTINKKIKTFIDICINRVERDTKYFIPNNNDDKFNLFIEYDIARVNKDIISFIFLINYSNNRDFNKTEMVTLSYNLKLGKSINLDNFFENCSSYKVTLCDMSKDYLQNNDEINDKVLSYLLDDISYNLQNSFDGYAFSNTHLSIYFNSNKISSKYNDIYEVKISWKDVKHLLKKNIYYAY